MMGTHSEEAAAVNREIRVISIYIGSNMVLIHPGHYTRLCTAYVLLQIAAFSHLKGLHSSLLLVTNLYKWQGLHDLHVIGK